MQRMKPASLKELVRSLSNSPCLVSNRLAKLAFLLWLASLLLPGLVFYTEKPLGLNFLLVGWAGPLALNFAWYANPLFLFATKKLITSRRSTTGSSIVATVLAADAFLFWELPLDEGGATTDLYGYGLGFLLWLAAILVLLAASGIRVMELEDTPLGFRHLRREPMVRNSALILGIVVGSFAFWGIKDRLEAGETERRFLKDVVFKLGPVCSVPDIKPQGQIALQGPLEIIRNDGYSTPLASPEDLLAWGVPRVRRKGYDYYLREPDNHSSIVAVPAKGPAGARLELGHSKQNGNHAIRARLVSVDGGTVGFEGEWVEPKRKERLYCPGYFTSPKVDEPPRSLLLATLTHADGTPLVARGDRRPTKDEWLKSSTVHSGRPVQRAQITDNPGCPESVGLRHLPREEDGSSLPKAVWNRLADTPVELYQIGEQLHYGIHGHKRQALCMQDATYIYLGRRWENQVELYLEKRRLPDFHRAWKQGRNIRVRMPSPRPSQSLWNIYITSLREEGDRLYITVAVFGKGEDEGLEFEIEANQEGS